MTTRDILSELKARGALHDASHEAELGAALQKETLSFYCGFDPTSDSLHVGSMLPLIMMRRLQRAGHKPIVLLGSGTGMVGDPSGKSEERKLLDLDLVKKNTEALEVQIRSFLAASGSTGFVTVRNDSWLMPLSLLEFLRDVGKHFSVNAMIAKDSVRERLENREQGISFTEFSYMLLQAYDFYYLFEHQNCRMQIGGSDQWGNITAGLELIRRRSASQSPAYGLTFPLLTTSAGTKFGKTERGAVWLDAKRTSPYLFYQFWFNTADADVIRYLKLFSDKSLSEIADLEISLQQHPEERTAQRSLAAELTTLVHGKTETEKAAEASAVLFGGAMEHLASSTLKEIFSHVPSLQLRAEEVGSGIGLQDLLVKASLAASKGAAKRLIEGGGVYVNNQRIGDVAAIIERSRFIDGTLLVLRSGKKSYALVQVL